MQEAHEVLGGESSAGKEIHPSPAPIYFAPSNTSPALHWLKRNENHCYAGYMGFSQGDLR